MSDAQPKEHAEASQATEATQKHDVQYEDEESKAAVSEHSH